jgi:protein-tyrosine phosphatase
VSDLHVTGSINLRDVGGLPAGSARTRSGVLFRSGSLARLDADGVVALGELGLRRIVDLRADDEVAYAPSRLPVVEDRVPIAVQRVPLFFGSMSSFLAGDPSLDELYALIVDRAGGGIVQVVRAVIADNPVLVHCTVGKDRTGVSVAIVLAAVGVDRAAIVADYARTETLLPASNRAMAAALRRAHPGSVHLEDLATRSPAPVMERMLGYVSARHGSAAGYLREHGMTDGELDELRRVLLE